jgi:hypothetical protein
MKKLLFVILTLVSLNAAAQNVRLNGYANYVFDDKVDSYYGTGGAYFDGKIKGGFQWGVGLEYMLSPLNAVEITYYNQPTSAIASYRNGTSTGTNQKFDVGVNWIMLNGVRHFMKPGGRFEGAAGAGLGVCIINTTNQKTGVDANTTKFAWQFRGGGTFWASEKVGIKINAQLQSAVQSIGGGFSIGTGGAGVGVSSYSSLLQFGLGGGLAIKLGGTTTAPRPVAVPRTM